jgi:hypothetical protein
VIAAIVRATGNALEAFQGGPTGSSSPLAVVSGPSTGLGTCDAAECDHLVVTFSSAEGTGRLYAGVSTPTGARIVVFAHDAAGDASPLQTIEGAATGLVGEVITGIAVSPCTRAIYVMVKNAQFGGSGSVLVFDGLTQGNAGPLRSFTDATTSFADGQGIAFGVGGLRRHPDIISTDVDDRN